MRIIFDPQVREEENDRIYYKFSEDIVEASYKDKKVILDFRGFGDGELIKEDPDTDEKLIDCGLEEEFITSAKREGGVLHLKLVNLIGFDASEEECFPEWVDHKDYRGVEPPDLKGTTVKITSWKGSNEKLQEQKENKKQELSRACEEAILSGFYTKIDVKEYRVSYDREAQTNLQERWALFENDIIQEVKMTVHEKETDEPIRIPVTKSQFTTIYLDSVKAKEDKISRLRDLLIPMVDQSVTEKEVELINWNNQVNHPEEPSIILSDENTLGKKVQRADQKTKQVEDSISMTNAGLLEIAMISMGF